MFTLFTTLRIYIISRNCGDIKIQSFHCTCKNRNYSLHSQIRAENVLKFIQIYGNAHTLNMSFIVTNQQLVLIASLPRETFIQRFLAIPRFTIYDHCMKSGEPTTTRFVYSKQWRVTSRGAKWPKVIVGQRGTKCQNRRAEK